MPGSEDAQAIRPFAQPADRERAVGGRAALAAILAHRAVAEGVDPRLRDGRAPRLADVATDHQARLERDVAHVGRGLAAAHHDLRPLRAVSGRGGGEDVAARRHLLDAEPAIGAGVRSQRGRERQGRSGSVRLRDGDAARGRAIRRTHEAPDDGRGRGEGQVRGGIVPALDGDRRPGGREIGVARDDAVEARIDPDERVVAAGVRDLDVAGAPRSEGDRALDGDGRSRNRGPVWSAHAPVEPTSGEEVQLGPFAQRDPASLRGRARAASGQRVQAGGESLDPESALRIRLRAHDARAALPDDAHPPRGLQARLDGDARGGRSRRPSRTRPSMDPPLSSAMRSDSPGRTRGRLRAASPSASTRTRWVEADLTAMRKRPAESVRAVIVGSPKLIAAASCTETSAPVTGLPSGPTTVPSTKGVVAAFGDGEGAGAGEAARAGAVGACAFARPSLARAAAPARTRIRRGRRRHGTSTMEPEPNL